MKSGIYSKIVIISIFIIYICHTANLIHSERYFRSVIIFSEMYLTFLYSVMLPEREKFVSAILFAVRIDKKYDTKS